MIEDAEETLIILVAPCGDEIEIWEPTIFRMYMYCNSCDDGHYYEIKR